MAKMEEHYGVVVGPQHKPRRFKTPPSPEETAVIDRYLVAQQALDEADAALRRYFEPLVDEAKRHGAAAVRDVLARVPASEAHQDLFVRGQPSDRSANPRE